MFIYKYKHINQTIDKQKLQIIIILNFGILYQIKKIVFLTWHII